MLVSQDLLTQQFKQCCRCKILKPLSLFNRDSTRADGFKYYCKKCDRERNKEYRHSLDGSLRSQRNIRYNNQRKEKNQELQRQLGSHLIYYIANPAQPHLIKIGYSSSFYLRIGSFLTGAPQLLLVALVQAESKQIEKEIHWQFAPLRCEGEWFIAKAPLLQHLDSLDTSLAQQCVSLLPPDYQSRITVPTKKQFLDMVPFVS